MRAMLVQLRPRRFASYSAASARAYHWARAGHRRLQGGEPGRRRRSTLDITQVSGQGRPFGHPDCGAAGPRSPAVRQAPASVLFFVGDEAQGHSLSTTYHPVEPTTGHLQAVGVVRHDFPLLPRGAGHVGHLRSFYDIREAAGQTGANLAGPVSGLQLALELIQEAPVGAFDEERIGARLNHADKPKRPRRPLVSRSGIETPGPQRLVARFSSRGTGIRGIQAYVILPVFTLRSAHGD